MRPVIFAAVLALVACGSQPATVQAGAATNGGVIPIATAATYQYSLTFQDGENGCPPGDIYNGSVIIGPPHPGLVLVSDLGTRDPLTTMSDGKPSSGSVYLIAGNWLAVYDLDDPQHLYPYPCRWSLTLTQQ